MTSCFLEMLLLHSHSTSLTESPVLFKANSNYTKSLTRPLNNSVGRNTFGAGGISIKTDETKNEKDFTSQYQLHCKQTTALEHT